MSLKAKTTRTENDLAEFASENSIPLSTLGSALNSSGMFTAFYVDAAADHGTVVYGTDETTGAGINGSTFAAAVSNGIYSSAINTANTNRVVLYIVVTQGNNAALNIGIRGTRNGDADVTVSSDWYRLITDDKTSSGGVHTYSETVLQLKSTLMATTGSRWMFEFDVHHSNYVSLVFYGSGTYQFTVYAEATH